MIKRAVIEKALRKVREDLVMNAAIDKRERSAAAGEINFVDEDIARTMVELPIQLQPNRNGLDAAQFKVYSDFSKLNYRSRLEQPNINGTFTAGQPQNSENFQKGNSAPPGQAANAPKKQEPAYYDFELDKILQKVDKEGQLTSVTRGLLTLKLLAIAKDPDMAKQH
jgi:hypothetical protein